MSNERSHRASSVIFLTLSSSNDAQRNCIDLQVDIGIRSEVSELVEPSRASAVVEKYEMGLD
jgi:hypothetical protein